MSTCGALERPAGALDAGERAVVDLAALLDQRARARRTRRRAARRRAPPRRAPPRRRRSRRWRGWRSGRPRPLRVAAAARRDSGRTTATTGTRRSSSSRSAGSAAAVAELQATTSSFAPRSSRMPASSRANACSSSGVRSPYGKARGVPEVEEVLMRKRHEALVQDGEPADAGVEDGDGQRAIGGRHGRQWWQAGMSMAMAMGWQPGAHAPGPPWHAGRSMAAGGSRPRTPVARWPVRWQPGAHAPGPPWHAGRSMAAGGSRPRTPRQAGRPAEGAARARTLASRWPDGTPAQAPLRARSAPTSPPALPWA